MVASLSMMNFGIGVQLCPRRSSHWARRRRSCRSWWCCRRSGRNNPGRHVLPLQVLVQHGHHADREVACDAATDLKNPMPSLLARSCTSRRATSCTRCRSSRSAARSRPPGSAGEDVAQVLSSQPGTTTAGPSRRRPPSSCPSGRFGSTALHAGADQFVEILVGKRRFLPPGPSSQRSTTCFSSRRKASSSGMQVSVTRFMPWSSSLRFLLRGQVAVVGHAPRSGHGPPGSSRPPPGWHRCSDHAPCPGIISARSCPARPCSWRRPGSPSSAALAQVFL